MQVDGKCPTRGIIHNQLNTADLIFFLLIAEVVTLLKQNEETHQVEKIFFLKTPKFTETLNDKPISGKWLDLYKEILHVWVSRR